MLSQEQQIKEQIKILRKKQDDLRRRKLITCQHCKKKTQISNATVVREHH